MRVTLVCRGAQNLAIEALSPALKAKGHQCGVVYDPGLFDDKYFLNIPPLAKVFDQTDDVVERIAKTNPDLVGFSVMTNLYSWALNTSAKLKERYETPIVFGGIHPSSAPEVVIKEKNVDFVIQGEGDGALADLADSLAQMNDVDSIPNVWTKDTIKKVELRPLEHDLDALPAMDKSIFMESCLLMELCLVVTSRGCPYACAYCCHSFLKPLYKGKGKYLRRRGVDSVIEECVRLKKDFGVKVLSFMDDVFSTDSKWLESFLRRYREEVSLPFLCNIHTKNLALDTARLLKDSGCVRLDFGVQSMNEKTRRDVLNRQSSNEEIKKAVAIFDRIKLPFHIHHIFGLPNDTEEDYVEAAKFYHSTKELVKINCFFLSYFPGTKILDYALANELLDKEQAERFKFGEDLNYYQGGSMPGINPETLKLARLYEKLFVLIPMVPHSFTGWIIKKQKIEMLKYIPGMATLLLEVFLVLINRNLRVIAYMKYYGFHAWNFIKKKFKNGGETR